MRDRMHRVKSIRPSLPIALLDLIERYEELNLKIISSREKYGDYVRRIWHRAKEGKGVAEEVYGVDGSKMSFETQSLTLFAVRAAAVPVCLRRDCVWRTREFTGFVTPSLKTNDRVILYMETLEAELVNELMGWDSLVLVDGALSVLAQCRTFEGRSCPCNTSYSNIEELALDEDLDAKCKLCMECKLKQYAVSQILSKAPPNIFYIAKKYHDSTIFGDDIMDDLSIIYVSVTYSEDLDGPGVTEPIEREVGLPLVKERRKVWFFYAKFRRGGNVYYVEVPRPITLEEALEFVESLAPFSDPRSGYPLPLRLAHKYVEYPQSLAFKLLKRLSGFVRTGREGL